MTDLEPWAVGDPPTIAVLNAGIESLTASKETVQPNLVKSVFESVIVILTLVRDEMIEEDSFVELAKLCVRTCHVLQTVIEGRDFDDLSGLIRRQIGDLGRTIRHIESVVRERADCVHNLRESYPECTRECIIVWREELLEMLRVFDGDTARGGALEAEHVQGPTDAEPSPAPALVEATSTFPERDRKSEESSFPELAPSSSLDRNLDVLEDAASLVLADSSCTDRDSLNEGDLPPLLPLADTNHPSASLLLLNSDKRALQRLVSRTVSQDELPSLIEMVVSNVKTADIVQCLRGSDAQVFIDVLDEALGNLDFAPRTRRECVKPLYKICAGHTMLPTSLRFELPEYNIDDIRYHGGFSDVVRCEYRGQEVAVKALRVHSNGSQGIVNIFCKEVITWRVLRHPNVLPLLGAIMANNRFAMMSEWMTNGNINQFVTAHPDANRFELLGGVAKGLIHVHSQGMVHGDLKGANILIDGTGRACLADFGLLTIAPDPTSVTSSNSFLQGGTCRWMSPELLDPDNFNLKDNRPTRRSDCYALGMVIYEVLAGRVPFSRHRGYPVVAKILKGERPERPERAGGTWFMDDVWDILERCWKPVPGDRPSIEDVLHCLEKVSSSWTSPSPQTAVVPPTIDPLAWNFDSSTEESVDECEVSSPPQIASPQPSQESPLEVLPCDALGHQGPEVSVDNLSGSGSKEFAEIPDRAPSADAHSRETPVRQRYTRNRRKAPPRSHPTMEVWERDDSGFGGFTEKELYGDHQTLLQWMNNKMKTPWSRRVFFFLP
ncbi:kinase-like protein [Thelephora ganbajun]|uniref:Kinase-like protein n=1 Tax=Thelephora ganbajun TaxID=370292 RepID=A0ACB6Z2Z6_THEGA|nr:kinase-like protein [Thelephora ganbajun]